MKSLSKLFFLVLLVFLSATSVRAQEAFPKIKFPCDQVNDPEFHSLRPYQAAACGDADKARYCSNDLKFIESFDVVGKNDCKARGYARTFTCHPNFTVKPHNLYVELTDSMFPIMGNTEQVKNYDKKEDEFDDAQKVNEYASWYLSGVNNKAEYGENTEDRVVNFSGPIQKLLPKLIQEAERIDTIKKAIVNEPYVDEDTGETITEPQNHNQIIVCSKGNDATPCPEGDKLRLSDWGEGNLSVVNTFFNWIGTDVWNYKYPPLPWQFSEQILYQKAYSEWQGKNCAILPIVGLQCLNTWVSNKWADLYQYIPLSNTTDKKGAENILDVQIKPSNGTSISGQSYNVGGQKNAPLYFAHTEEVKELSNLLNKTYTPADYESEPLPKTTEKNVCSAVNVRTNKGDDLFPGDREVGDTKEIVIPGVTYKITEAQCKETYKVDHICNPNQCGLLNPCCDIVISDIECNAEVTVTVKTGTKTPNADEIFSTTVADSGSTFRKMFPKVGEGSPVTCIADIPTVTEVTYNAEESEIPNGGSLEFQVKKYPEDGGGNTPELTFPHVGSIYEYFLKGIQTALRPKGYGEPITDGTLCKPTTTTCGEWEDKLEKTSGGDCGVCTSGLGDLAKRILATAGKQYNVPAANIWAAMQHEGADWNEFRGQFTDENVRKWSTPIECGGEPMPRCDVNDKTSSKSYPPFGFLPYWFYKDEGEGAIWTAVQEFDPTRNSIDKVSHCNFVDAAFASAKSLATWSGFARTPTLCYGQNLSSSIRPASCGSSEWTDAKVVQSQVGYWIGITPWCPDGTGGPSPLVNNIPIPDYASRVLSDFKSAKCN